MTDKKSAEGLKDLFYFAKINNLWQFNVKRSFYFEPPKNYATYF